MKVFGAVNCTGCVTVKRLLKDKSVEFTEFDVNSYEDMEAAMVYGVRSIPTIIVETLDGDHPYSYVGEKACVEFVKNLEV